MKKSFCLHNTKEWKEMIAEVDRRVAAEGGSTGSNMAEPLYFAPGPAPANLPPQEIARRKKAAEGIVEMVRLARSHVKD